MNRYMAVLASVMSVVVVYLSSQSQAVVRVDAGGPQLRMLLTGSGNPTVVLETGAGFTLEAWSRVQPEVSRFAKTISYDRAGVGGSPDGPLPRDGRTVAAELRTALRANGISAPYVLVGWSLGGLYVRVFADMYPDEVAGIVLVDPMRHDEFDVEGFEGSEIPEQDAMPATMTQARDGAIPPHIPVFLISAIGPRAQDIPYLTSQDEPWLKRYPSERQEDLLAHQEWLKGIPRGRLIITENSGHVVPFEEPQLIVDSIRQVIEEAKRR